MFAHSLFDSLEDMFPIANPVYHSQNPYAPRVSHVMVAVPKKKEMVTPTNAPKSTEFKRTLELGQFKPEDLKVNVTGDILTVQGTTSETSDTSSYECSFKRIFRIPKGIDPETVYCRVEGNAMEIGGTKKNPHRSIDIKVEQHVAENQDDANGQEKETMEQ